MKQFKCGSLTCVVLAVVFAVSWPAHAQLVFQDGFNYPVGNLNNNPPWGGGTTAGVTVSSGNLTYAGLLDLGGGDVVVTGGAAGANQAETNIFTTATSSGTVYLSFLIDFTGQPAAAPNGALLMTLGPSTGKPVAKTAPSLTDIYGEGNGGGWSIGAFTTGGGTVSYDPAVLNLNQTYFVVEAYNFSSFTESLYVNPVPGGTQPVTAGVANVGNSSTPIQDVGIPEINNTSQGVYVLDNLMVG